MLTFHLRQGVRWHDGAPFTSKDVLFTYRRIVDPAFGARADQFQGMEEVTAPDEQTVRVRYRAPEVLALDPWKVPILPEHLLRPVGPENRDLAASRSERARFDSSGGKGARRSSSPRTPPTSLEHPTWKG